MREINATYRAYGMNILEELIVIDSEDEYREKEIIKTYCLMDEFNRKHYETFSFSICVSKAEQISKQIRNH